MTVIRFLFMRSVVCMGVFLSFSHVLAEPVKSGGHPVGEVMSTRQLRLGSIFVCQNRFAKQAEKIIQNIPNRGEFITVFSVQEGEQFECGDLELYYKVEIVYEHWRKIRFERDLFLRPPFNNDISCLPQYVHLDDEAHFITVILSPTRTVEDCLDTALSSLLDRVR